MPYSYPEYKLMRSSTGRLKRIRKNNKKYLRIKLIMRDGNSCAYCGTENKSLEIDHIIPKSKGGVNDINNLVLSCRDCNSKKDDKLPHEIEDIELRQKVKQLRIHARTQSKNY